MAKICENKSKKYLFPLVVSGLILLKSIVFASSGEIKGQIIYTVDNDTIIGARAPVALISFETLKKISIDIDKEFEEQIQVYRNNYSKTNKDLQKVCDEIESTYPDIYTLLWNQKTNLSFSDYQCGKNLLDETINDIERFENCSKRYLDDIKNIQKEYGNVKSREVGSYDYKEVCTGKINSCILSNEKQKKELLQIIENDLKKLIDIASQQCINATTQRLLSGIDLNLPAECKTRLEEMKKKLYTIMDKLQSISEQILFAEKFHEPTDMEKQREINEKYKRKVQSLLDGGEFDSIVYSDNDGLFSIRKLNPGMYKLYSNSAYGLWILDIKVEPNQFSPIILNSENSIYKNNPTIVEWGKEEVITYSDNNISISLNNIYKKDHLENNILDLYQKPMNDYFLIIVLKIKNNGNIPYSLIMNQLMFHIEDDIGRIFEENSPLTAILLAEDYVGEQLNLPDHFADRLLNPGDTGYKVFVYDLSNKIKSKYLVMSLLLSNEKIRFGLKTEKPEKDYYFMKYWHYN